MGVVERLLEQIVKIFTPYVEVERKVVDVEGWDGAASNYADTVEYCNACLINTNVQAGNTDEADWTQTNCKLPVRGPDDGTGTYVRQAIHAAAVALAGGRTPLAKPAGVSEGDWNSAVKKAARELISAYDQADEQAPDSVYEKAGETPPKEKSRGLTMEQIQEQIFTSLRVSDPEEQFWPYSLYREDDGLLYLILSSAGKLYRAPVTFVDANTVALGDAQEVAQTFAPATARSVTRVIRQADGRTRWISVSATAILNRVGEIDSTDLFDSFVKHAQETNQYPQRDFFHLGEMWRTGQADFLARDGVCYITSGLYDQDNPLAQAEIAAIEREGERWGESIQYTPTKPPEGMEVAPGVTVQVYSAGINTFVSTVPENRAAAWFTTITQQEVNRMKMDKSDPVFTALVDLCGGDETRARKLAEQRVNPLNRQAAEGQVVARAVCTTPIPPAPTAPVEREVVLDDAALEAIAGKLTAQFAPLLARLDALDQAVAGLRGDQANASEVYASAASEAERARAALDERLRAIERTDEEKQRAWIEGLPVSEIVRVTHKPREANAAGGDGDAKARAREIRETALAKVASARKR